MSTPQNNAEAVSSLAQVFLTALNASGEEVRREVFARMLENEDLRDEIEAALLWEERKDEDSVPLRSILSTP